MKITVVGLGYVGLSNAVLLAQHNEVIGVDISQARVDALNARVSPIIDVELSEYLAEKDLAISASTDLKASVRGADWGGSELLSSSSARLGCCASSRERDCAACSIPPIRPAFLRSKTKQINKHCFIRRGFDLYIVCLSASRADKLLTARSCGCVTQLYWPHTYMREGVIQMTLPLLLCLVVSEL